MTTKISKDNIQGTTITSAEIANDTIETTKIKDGTIANADVSPSAAIAITKIDGAASSSDLNTIKDNVGLLGFKMAVNEGLTVFNFVDGVVDEFNDESGTDEAEGSNDLYCGTDDYYSNSTPDPISAGFTTSSITEPDTSTTGTNASYGCGTMGQFTVPFGMTSATIKVWGSGGTCYGGSGGGGFSTGTLAVTAGQTLYVTAGEGGKIESGPGGTAPAFLNGGRTGSNSEPLVGFYGSGGGLAGVFSTDLVPLSAPQYSAPTAYVVAGSGAAGSYSGGKDGGAGGGQTGCAGGTTSEQTNNAPGGGTPVTEASGGGGSQSQGGQGGVTPSSTGQNGSLFTGGTGSIPGAAAGGGGAGYYGGAGAAGEGNAGGPYGAGGGGSSYFGHPQITSGSTEEGAGESGGGTSDPDYVPGTNEAGAAGSGPGLGGEDGYVLISGSKLIAASTTIVSDTFTSTTVPTSSRIVVFEENVDTPTLNTDIIASVCRDGTNFTTATLSDSGYVTGSSGQRILTGQADISGQPSGQSMRWKLQLANNQVKIHGVSLSWA